MNAQDLILGARVAHVRELRAELAKAKAENARLHDENAALKAHFDFALLAAAELRQLPPGGLIEIWDGWNLILGAGRVATGREDLVAQATARLAEEGRESLRIWIVFDGPDEKVAQTGRLRVSYTGGAGEHRADRLVISFVRMAAYLGLADRIAVRTRDKDFVRTVRRFGVIAGERGARPYQCGVHALPCTDGRARSPNAPLGQVLKLPLRKA